MPTQYSHIPGSKLELAEQILKAAICSWNQVDRENRAAHPVPLFVTVSRQPGTGADSFSHRLAQRLNEVEGANWSAWNRELIDKVSAEDGIAKDILEMIEKRPHSWLDTLRQDLSVSDNTPDATDLRAYKQHHDGNSSSGSGGTRDHRWTRRRLCYRRNAWGHPRAAGCAIGASRQVHRGTGQGFSGRSRRTDPQDGTHSCETLPPILANQVNRARDL